MPKTRPAESFSRRTAAPDPRVIKRRWPLKQYSPAAALISGLYIAASCFLLPASCFLLPASWFLIPASCFLQLSWNRQSCIILWSRQLHIYGYVYVLFSVGWYKSLLQLCCEHTREHTDKHTHAHACTRTHSHYEGGSCTPVESLLRRLNHHYVIIITKIIISRIYSASCTLYCFRFAPTKSLDCTKIVSARVRACACVCVCARARAQSEM